MNCSMYNSHNAWMGWFSNSIRQRWNSQTNDLASYFNIIKRRIVEWVRNSATICDSCIIILGWYIGDAYMCTNIFSFFFLVKIIVLARKKFIIYHTK